jgi:very-short-patch-repair endonuclease
METRTRMLIVLAGMPTPMVNLQQAVAGVQRRFDLCWPDAMVIVEYDGRHHIERERQWADDLLRREAIEAAGWTLIVLIASDIYTSPAATLERIAAPLANAGLISQKRPLPGQWRAHFQDRAAA